MGDTLYWASELNADLLAFIKRERPDRRCYIDSNGCVSVSDPRVGRWWLSSWRGRPSGQIVYMVDRVDPDPSVNLGGPDVRKIGQTLPGEPMEAIFRIQRFQDAPAQALPASSTLADLIDARAQIAALTAERDEAREHYRFMVERAADQRLDGYRELGATAAAAENASDSLRAQVLALTAERDARVTVEAHARAVRNMLIGVAAAYRAASGCGRIEAERVAAAGWTTSLDRADLLATLAPIVGADRAVALVDGDASRSG